MTKKSFGKIKQALVSFNSVFSSVSKKAFRKFFGHLQ
jgi:hypothetical protein